MKTKNAIFAVPGEWTYNGVVFTEEMIEDNVGFVYLITNRSNNKKYIGKKLFTKSKTYQKNKKKKRTRVASDWKDYCGSNEELKAYMKENGPYKLSKEILHLCKTKGWLSYLETKEIILHDALLKEDYYNTWFSVRIRNTHLK